MRLILILTFILMSCSPEKFDEESHLQILLDGFDYNIIFNNTLELSENIFIMNNGEPIGYTYINDLLLLEHLQDFFWLVNSDTIRNYNAVSKQVPYGMNFVKLFLRDVWGDTSSHSEYIRVSEPLGITLLSPVDNYSASKGDIIEFQYRISGISKEDASASTIYICAGENCICKDDNCDEASSDWEILNGNSYKLTDEPVFWVVEAAKKEFGAIGYPGEITNIFSEIRSIWPKD